MQVHRCLVRHRGHILSKSYVSFGVLGGLPPQFSALFVVVVGKRDQCRQRGLTQELAVLFVLQQGSLGLEKSTKLNYVPNNYPAVCTCVPAIPLTNHRLLGAATGLDLEEALPPPTLRTVSTTCGSNSGEAKKRAAAPGARERRLPASETTFRASDLG